MRGPDQYKPGTWHVTKKRFLAGNQKFYSNAYDFVISLGIITINFEGTPRQIVRFYYLNGQRYLFNDFYQCEIEEYFTHNVSDLKLIQLSKANRKILEAKAAKYWP